jgi:hypothetical protein
MYFMTVKNLLLFLWVFVFRGLEKVEICHPDPNVRLHGEIAS